MRWIRRSSRAFQRIGPTLAACVVLAGCPEAPEGPRYKGAGHQEPQRGGTFTFFHESDVRTLDPHIAYDELSIIGLKLLFDGLLDYDHQARLVPRIATSMPTISNGGKTFVFELRKGVRFHNGRELKASDVQWSMEHMLDPDVGSPGYTFYTQLEGLEAYRDGEAEHISGIDVRGPYTVAFHLKAPDQTFLNAMAMTFAYPVAKEAYAKHGDRIGRHPVGTGPFVLEEWEPAVRMLFERNPNYWRPGEPYLDRMIFQLNLNRATAFMRFRNGEMDVAHRFTPADYLFIKQAPKWQGLWVEEPQVNIFGLVMNCEMEPFDNVHLRRAVAFALDRKRWAKARNHRIRPAGQPLPPQLMGYRENLKGRHHHDLDKARAEMRKAGHPDGLPEPITVWIGEQRTSQFYGELVQADLKKIGIQVRLKPVSFPVYLQETGKPGRAQAFMSGWSQDFPDPANFLDILFHTRAIHEHDSENRAFYRNPELDALLDEARVEPDPDKRETLYVRAQEIVVRDAPWAFLFNDKALEAWQPYVRNYTPNPVWSELYRDVWLDLPRRRIAWQRFGRGALRRLAAALPFGGH